MIFKVEKAQRAAMDLIKYCVIYRFSPKVTKNRQVLPGIPEQSLPLVTVQGA